MDLLKNLEASVMFYWFSDVFVFPRRSHKSASVRVCVCLVPSSIWRSCLLGSRCNCLFPADVSAAAFRLSLILQISLFSSD